MYFIICLGQASNNEKKSRTKAFMDSLDFNLLSAMPSSVNSADETLHLDLPSTSSASLLRSQPHHSKVSTSCMRKGN